MTAGRNFLSPASSRSLGNLTAIGSHQFWEFSFRSTQSYILSLNTLLDSCMQGGTGPCSLVWGEWLRDRSVGFPKMMLTVAGLLTPALYILALAVTSASGYLLYRQSLSTYRMLRDFLVGVSVLVGILITLELWRTVAGNVGSMEFYAAASITLGMIQAMLLAVVAVGTYIQPTGSDYRSLLRESPGASNARCPPLALCTSFASGDTACSSLQALHNRTSVYHSRRRSLGDKDPSKLCLPAGRSPFLFPLLSNAPSLSSGQTNTQPNAGGQSSESADGWAAVIVIYLIFESLLWFFGIDATAVMYLLNAVLFSLVTRRFSKAAVLAGLVVPAAPQRSVQHRAKTIVGIRASEFSGRPILFLVDPSSPFESAVKDIASDLVSQGRNVFVFTSRGSRIGGALSSMEGVKLYLFTTNVSYYQPGERPNEVLLAATNISVALDAIGKTLGTVTEHGLFILFDSLSDLILSSGFDETYRFLKTTLEMASDKSVISVFIILSGAHEHAIENIIRSRFSVEIVQDEGVLRVSKAPVAEGPT